MFFIRLLIEIVCVLVIIAVVVGGGAWVLSKMPKKDKSVKDKLQERKEELKDLAGMAKQADELKPLVKKEEEMKAKVEGVLNKEGTTDGTGS